MKSHEKFTEGVCTGLAGISKGSTYQDGLKKNAMTLTYLSVYYFIGSKRENQSKFFAANPDVETSAMIWNLLDDKKIKTILNRFLPNLSTAKRVKVPKLDTKITLENIESLPSVENWKSTLSDGKWLEGGEVNWETHSQLRVLSNCSDPENLLIHVHGGGFISMSSGSH